MATLHIGAGPGDFAPDVLMPGDPRRARRIAETVLDDARLVTEVRGILGYTGTFEGRPVSVLASGMGMPSITIYATELFRFYGVQRSIRIGTAGGMATHLDLGDVVNVGAVVSNDAFYTERPVTDELLVQYGTLAVEMEAAALYAAADAEGHEALAICTISDLLFRDAALSADEREQLFDRGVRLG